MAAASVPPLIAPKRSQVPRKTFITSFLSPEVRPTHRSANLDPVPKGRSGDDLGETDALGSLELIPSARGRILVRTPAVEAGRMSKPTFLELVVADLHNQPWIDRRPGEIFVSRPAADTAGCPGFFSE